MLLEGMVICMITLLVVLKGRRKFRRYIRGNIDHRLQLSTLNGGVVLGTPLADTVTEPAWCSSVKATWSLDQLTPVAGAGPIMVGIAHSNYTDAEIEEWVENLANWDEGDLVAQEIAKRKIRIVGTFAFPASFDAQSQSVLNDGKAVRTKCGWLLREAATLRIFAYNTGSSSLATTNPNVRVQGHANLWPQ